MIRRMSMGLALSAALAVAAPTHASPPIQAATLDHVAIQAADLDKSAAFYTSLFGLAEVRAPFPGVRWLALGGGVLLHIVGNRTGRSAHSRWDHIAFACTDMDAMIATLAMRHIPWVAMDGTHAPQVRPDGVKQIFVRDPDGYWIEINDARKMHR